MRQQRKTKELGGPGSPRRSGMILREINPAARDSTPFRDRGIAFVDDFHESDGATGVLARRRVVLTDRVAAIVADAKTVG